MKKFSILILLLLGLVNLACNDSQSIRPREAELDSNFSAAKEDLIPGKIPTDLTCFNIILDTTNHTWVDLDQWYRNELPNHLDKPYYRNLEGILFYHLVEGFRLDEKADIGTVNYYVIKQMDYGLHYAPGVFVKCLQRLERDGVTKYLYQYAANKYGIDMAQLDEKPAMESFRERYSVLEEYKSHLAQRFNVKQATN